MSRSKIAKLATLVALAIPAVSAISSYAADNDYVALVKNVSGNVKILRQNATMDAVSGKTLLVSDHVVSGPGASAGIVFKDGTLLTVGPSSDVHVRNFIFEPMEAKYDFSVYLAKGSAIYSSGKIGKLSPESVKVGTPTATVGVRGTRFIVEAEQDQP